MTYGICDWSAVNGVEDLTLPSCSIGDQAECAGHKESDILEFSDQFNDGKFYNNSMWYELLHPWSERLPYTYDKFSFDYCEDFSDDPDDKFMHPFDDAY
jgi:hypothetical protein